MPENLSAKIEAILFLMGEPVKIGFLSKNLNESAENIVFAISKLEKELKNRGICLMRKDDKIMLATSPNVSDTTKKIIKEKYEEELTKPMLETLAIILYNNPVKKTDIDYLRGVNSVFTLRNLAIRGLIERKETEDKSSTFSQDIKADDKNSKGRAQSLEKVLDKNVFVYIPSFELMRFLGIKNTEELPQKNEFKEKIKKFLSEHLEN